MTHDYVPLPGSVRAVAAGTQHIGQVDDDERVGFTAVLRRRADLPTDLVEGPNTVSRTELGDRFGADPADVATVRAAFEAAGVTVTDVYPESRRISGEGPASAVSALFGAELTMVSSPDPAGGDPVRHRSRSGELRVPSALDGVVVAVLGLDTRPQVRAHVRMHAGAAAAPGFDVPSLATVYDFPADTDGTGQIAAIVEFGGGYGQTDLDAYFAGIDLPTPTVTSVSVDGAQNVVGQAPDGADLEVLLDIEVLGALAPKAALTVYFGTNTDQGFLDTVSTAVHATPSPTVVSISWGQPENQWSEQARTALDEVFADAAALGITVCVSAGDNGSTDNETDGAQHTDFPASSVHVLACGGTSLTVDASGAAQSETVWNDRPTGGATGGATGGGVSTAFPLPSWQSEVAVPTRSGGTGTGRGVPDVAAVADPDTGYRVLVDGKPGVFGGTSAVAPLWSALVCRFAQSLGTSLGLLQPVMYASATAGTATAGFRDITQGNNGAYQATAGWDACTGLGVPVGSALLAVFQHNAAGEAVTDPS